MFTTEPVETFNPMHLSLSQEHPTPVAVVSAAIRVLGDIDLDPASCAEFNRRVLAREYYGLPQDGLALPWSGRVFLNPPGGTFTAKRKKKIDPMPAQDPIDMAHKARWKTDSRATAWWRRLVTEYAAGNVEQAIYIGFTLNILQSSQSPHWPNPLDFSICVPAQRLCFQGDQPTHGNVIVYLGAHRETFREAFAEIGAVKL